MTHQQTNYHVIGIGIGPANLGLAALLTKAEDIQSLFFDESPEFQWHPGMLIEGADLQVPFLADLVTLADPTSPFTFLNYLSSQGRLHAFFFFNRFDIPRREYNHYARWTAGQLNNCLFGRSVTNVVYKEGSYHVCVLDQETKVETTYYADHIVVGTGTKPLIPEPLQGHPPEDVLHTSQYVMQEDSIAGAEKVLIAGSGQSAAEVFLELLQKDHRPELNWYTRSAGFFQLESGKLGQEIFSPDYIDYFHALPLEKRLDELPNLTQLRNGVEESTLHKIYDVLYHRTTGGHPSGTVIQANTEVKDIKAAGDGSYEVTLHQHQQEKTFRVTADKVILGTGYKPDIPEWLETLTKDADREDDRLKINRRYHLSFPDERSGRLYTLTDIVHSHGAGATNLALAVNRNVTIINDIAGRTIYQERENTVFQQFGASQSADEKE
ncbi:lysine N(6)-hydroxylase/L-ornithine N(5)-oxygenase family protein [Alkalicoccus luteus]|uniref:L-lysine N6-monooxygenase MbtG n=1 Tax=Alkalicoccus luteus TaxID=1237094 RepID=A0A969Q061_9BACI|nr:SidA/IucD/PvdA family monooxygenase [Alkalicoccus luteus]NJP38732.1 SidA/IucD/PvdA family monooxygenase [Alkalicoccus luteus]